MAKLGELGFDCRTAVTGPSAREHCATVPPVPVHLVLEYESDTRKSALPSPGRKTRLNFVRIGKWSTIENMDRAILAQEALKLPAWERAQIIDVLWRSLDPEEQAAIDQAWVCESEDRLEAHRKGNLDSKDTEESLRG